MYKIFSLILLTFFSVSCFAEDALADNFAYTLSHRTLKDEGNVFISPYSAKIALRMAMDGAIGNTYAEMQKVLGSEPLKIINGGGFSSCQALAVDQRYPFLKSYVDGIQKDYQAALLPVDFFQQRELAVVIVNRWVGGATNGLIPELLQLTDVNPLTKLILLNACHFKKVWRHAFDEKLTQKAPFTTSQGTIVDVDMMSQNSRFKYAKEGKAAYIELDFQTKAGEPEYSALLILPEDQKTLTQLERHLDRAKLKKVDSLLKEDRVQLFLPKMDIKFKIDLVEKLQKLGMSEAFADNARFDKMTGKADLRIDKVIQQTRLKINETGLEAAAATAVIMVEKVGFDPRANIVLRFDHPFLIVIREKESGTILFSGRISDPTSLP